MATFVYLDATCISIVISSTVKEELAGEVASWLRSSLPDVERIYTGEVTPNMATLAQYKEIIVYSYVPSWGHKN